MRIKGLECATFSAYQQVANPKGHCMVKEGTSHHQQVQAIEVEERF
jgi:hypothetical protein